MSSSRSPNRQAYGRPGYQAQAQKRKLGVAAVASQPILPARRFVADIHKSPWVKRENGGVEREYVTPEPLRLLKQKLPQGSFAS